MVSFRKRLYMDYASSTPLERRVRHAMHTALQVYGNPSAPHAEGRRAKKMLEEARTRIARVLAVRPETLHFTASGTESNNSAITGFIEHFIKKGARYEDLHIIISDFEHPSVLEPVAALERKGVQVSRVQPDSEGTVAVHAVAERVRPETVLVSVTLVQGEIGQIQPIHDIARALETFQKKRTQKNQHHTPECALPVLHTDASQAPLYLDAAPEHTGVRLATYDAQKIRGPKGVGLVYTHSSVTLEPVVRGGSQERGIRAGTENVVGIHGMAVAFELAKKGRKERVRRLTLCRDYFIHLLAATVPQAEINGGVKNRVANNVHISVPGADGDYLAVLMDTKGVAVSARSACIAGGIQSHTVEALGKSAAQARGTLRFSFGPYTTKRDVRRAVRALAECVQLVTTPTPIFETAPGRLPKS